MPLFKFAYCFLALNEISLLPSSILDTLLLFVGLIVIAPITSNFIYSYKNNESKIWFILGHITTFFSMLVIWMLFIALDILLILMIWDIIVFRLALMLFWFAVISYDFAGIFTIEKQKNK